MGFKFDESAEQLKTSSRQEVFVSRLEENLETKINKLIQEDTEKAVVLEQLKKELISEIKIGYQEESYIEDLRLDLKELEEIYNMPHLKVLFEEANIATFDQFMDLLSSDIMKSKEDGISGLDEDEYLIGGQLIRLGLDVKYMRSQVCDHLKDILRGVLSKPILANTIILESIKSIGSNVISFFTVENGNAIEYIAVRNSIYRLKECSDPRKVEAYMKLKDAAQKASLEASIYLTEIREKDDRVDIVDERYLLLYKRAKDLQSQVLHQKSEALGSLFEDIENGELHRGFYDEGSGNFVLEKFDDNQDVVLREKFNAAWGKVQTERYLGDDKWDMKEHSFEGVLVRHSVRDDKDGSESIYRSDGTLTKLIEKGVVTDFDESGKPKLRIYRSTNTNSLLRVFLYDDKGEAIALFPEEKEINEALTEDQYLDYLAKQLDTPEKMDLFFRFYLRYEFDHKKYNPEASVLKNIMVMMRYEDYWQQPAQTARRVEDNSMLGDCDDYAFLAQTILDRQSKFSGVQKNAHVIRVNTPRGPHAVCVWSIKREDGKHDFYSIGTYGLDRNGNAGGASNKYVSDGFDSIAEGLRSVMFKYTDSEDIDPDKLNPVEKSVTLLEVPTEGATQYVKGVPLEVFVDDKAYDSWKRLKPFIDDRDFDSFNKAIANLPPRDYYRDWMVKSAKEIE